MYIWQNRDWPRFSYDQDILREPLLLFEKKKSLLCGLLIADPVLREEHISAALSDSLSQSWSIENLPLDTNEVYSSVRKHLNLQAKFNKSVSEYVENLVQVLFEALAAQDAKLTEEMLFSWHARIIGNNTGSFFPVASGKYRNCPIDIITDSKGKESVLYEAVPANSIACEMKTLFAYINNKKEPSPVIRSAVVHLWFESIHPFEDGNGRMGRIISDYVLAEKTIEYPLVFVSTAMKGEKSEYYRQLESAQKNTMDCTTWILFFIKALSDSYEKAIQTTIYAFQLKLFFSQACHMSLNERQLMILQLVSRKEFLGAITTKKYAQIAKCHIDTANRDMKKLVSLGLLHQEKGESKNTHYTVVLPELWHT